MQLPEGWEPVVGKDASDLEAELRREVAPSHPLRGRTLRAIARRRNRKDVLFRSDSASGPVFWVHLTWTVETDAKWPSTESYASVDDFVTQWVEDHDTIKPLQTPYARNTRLNGSSFGRPGRWKQVQRYRPQGYTDAQWPSRFPCRHRDSTSFLSRTRSTTSRISGTGLPQLRIMSLCRNGIAKSWRSASLPTALRRRMRDPGGRSWTGLNVG